MQEIMNVLKESAPLAVKILVFAVFLMCARYIVPWLKNQGLYDTVKKFVWAAEKLAAAGKLPKENKKGYVCRMLNAAGVKVTPVVEAMIEAAVEALDIAKQEYPLFGVPEENDDDDEDAEEDPGEKKREGEIQ